MVSTSSTTTRITRLKYYLTNSNPFTPLVTDLPVPPLTDWVFLRAAYAANQGLEAMYEIFPDYTIDSFFLPEIEVKLTQGHGRGVFAAQDIGEKAREREKRLSKYVNVVLTP